MVRTWDKSSKKERVFEVEGAGRTRVVFHVEEKIKAQTLNAQNLGARSYAHRTVAMP